nr:MULTISPECIES: transposase [unclassified Raoultella]
MLIEMPVSPQSRKAAPHLPAVWRARMVSYVSGGGKGKITGFLTSMTDPAVWPVEDLLRIYWERWEIELGYGELKRRQLKGEVTLRSRFPEGVKQELWGILVSYNLLRKEMVDIAGEAGVIPTRISFIAALNILVSQVRVSGKGAAGSIPKHLKGMRENVKAFILPEKRKHRRYDRTVLYVPPTYPFSFKSRGA